MFFQLPVEPQLDVDDDADLYDDKVRHMSIDEIFEAFSLLH